MSWAAAVASVIVPCGVWHWQIHAFDAWAARQPVPVCGMPVLSIFGAALLLASACSLAAVGLGVWAYRRQPGPRTVRRSGEVLLLAAPLLAASAFVAWMLRG